MKCKRFFSAILALALLAGCAAAPSSESQVGQAPTASPTASTVPALPGQSTAESENSATPAPVSADWAPDHEVTMIVAYKEGSSTDQGARLLAQYAEQYIGQTVTIKNIAANSGMTGWETLAAANPDGYTLGFINLPNIFTAIENGGSFTTQSFAPICSHVVETSVVVVPENSPYQTLEELIAANQAASDAGSLLRASTNGVQASNDIGAALLAYASGRWRFRHVSYGSTSDQLAALLSGECDWAVAKVSDILPYLAAEDPVLSEEGAEGAAVSGELPTLSTDLFASDTDAGADGGADEIMAESLPTADADAHTDLGTSEHLRALGLFGTARAPELPGLPTLDELGYPTGWYGSTRAVVAPAGTDEIILNFYADAFRRAMEDADCIKAHEDAGFSLLYLGPKDLADRIDERERFNHSLLPRLFAA